MKQKFNFYKSALVAMLTGFAMSIPSWAKDEFPSDVPNSSDPVMLKRFAGSTLIGYKVDSWDAARFPLSATVDRNAQNDPFKDLITVEGMRTRAVYLSPKGKSPLEIYRNYEQALSSAGFKKKFSCEAQCEDAYFALHKLDIEKGLAWSKGYIPNISEGSYAVDSALSHEEGRLLVGTLPYAGSNAWILVYVSKAANSNTVYSQAFIQVVQPKQMQTGQVKILNAADIGHGLRNDGKIAFYGLYFDTGKADIKPNSQVQLNEIGKLLKAQPNLQAFIVGHTDGQGQLDDNLSLSQRRAQAVVDALSKQEGINARRLTAKGVASLSPLAANTSEEGRARNRRVELVVR
jgi:OmpA-OmpF porin, OOP family